MAYSYRDRRRYFPYDGDWRLIDVRQNHNSMHTEELYEEYRTGIRWKVAIPLDIQLEYERTAQEAMMMEQENMLMRSYEMQVNQIMQLPPGSVISTVNKPTELKPTESKEEKERKEKRSKNIAKLILHRKLKK